MLLRSSLGRRVVAATGASVRMGRRSVWFDTDASNYAKRSEQRIDWDNPGDRLKYVPDEIVYALPPPGRPAYPYTDEELRRRETRTRIPLLLLVLLALGHVGYTTLHKRRDIRAWVERTVPAAARLLRLVGLFPSFPEAEPLARREAFQRVWMRYAEELEGEGASGGRSEEAGVAAAQRETRSWSDGAEAGFGGAGVHASEAVAMALRLREAWDGRSAAAPPAAAGASAGVEELRRTAGRVMAERGERGREWMGRASFVAFLEAAMSDVPDLVLYEQLGESLGVWSVRPELSRAFGDLYDFVVAENRGSCVFTVPFLAAVTEEVGFGALEDAARESLTEARSVQLGRISVLPEEWVVMEPSGLLIERRKPVGEMSREELADIARRVAEESKALRGVDPAPGTDWSARRDGAGEAVSAKLRDLRAKSRLLVRSSVRVPLAKHEFVNHLAYITRNMTHEDVDRFLAVFYMLTAMKPSANVPATTVESAARARGSSV
jgi:hypothetical protein